MCHVHHETRTQRVLIEMERMSVHLHHGGKVFDSLVAEGPPDPAPSGTIDEKPVSRASDPSCSRISFDFCKAKNPRRPTESLVASFNLQLFEPAVISLIVISAGELPNDSPRRIGEPPPCSSKFRVIRLRKSVFHGKAPNLLNHVQSYSVSLLKFTRPQARQILCTTSTSNAAVVTVSDSSVLATYSVNKGAI